MEKKQLNEKESLELISRMIRNTQNRLESGQGSYFLIFGYLTLFVSLLVGILTKTIGYHGALNWLWLLIPVIGYIGVWYLVKYRSSSVTTYVDRVIGYIWIVVGIAACLLPIAMIFIPKPAGFTFPIFFVSALLVSIGIALTGLAIRYKPIAIGGFLGLLLAYGFLFVPNPGWYVWGFALFALVSMVIPGHMLNQYIRKTQN